MHNLNLNINLTGCIVPPNRAVHQEKFNDPIPYLDLVTLKNKKTRPTSFGLIPLRLFDLSLNFQLSYIHKRKLIFLSVHRHHVANIRIESCSKTLYSPTILEKPERRHLHYLNVIKYLNLSYNQFFIVTQLKNYYS